MNWQFWKKDDHLLAELKTLGQKITDLKDTVNELSQHNKQMNRLHYKSSQLTNKELQKLDKKIEKQEINRAQINQLREQIDQCRAIINTNIDSLLGILDEIDLVRQGLSAEENNWSLLLDKWAARLLNTLKEEDVYQIELVGRPFDPRLAEAVSVIGKQELSQSDDEASTYNNHEIVEVIKRGFNNSSGEVIRKASVIIFKGEDDG